MPDNEKNNKPHLEVYRGTVRLVRKGNSRGREKQKAKVVIDFKYYPDEWKRFLEVCYNQDRTIVEQARYFIRKGMREKMHF